MARRRRGTPRSFPLIWLVLLLPVVALAAVYLLFDPNSLKPRIAEAARAALGRPVVLRGPVSLALSLAPTLEASDIGVANPAGFARPELATLGRAEAELALWPLLRGRIEITRLVLVHPDVMLETDARGQENWHLGPAVRPASAGAGGEVKPASAGEVDGPRFDVHALRVEGGRIQWRDDRAGVVREADLDRMVMVESAAAEPGLSVTGTLSAEGHAVTVTAEIGTVAQLLMASEARPWPLQVVLRSDGTRLAASGTVAHPLQGRGYAVTLDASAPDLAAAGARFGMTLPGLRDVSATAKVSDASGAPQLTQLAAHAGPSALVLGRRHLALDRLELSTPAIDQPVHGELVGTLESAPVRLTAELGSLAAMRADAELPLGVTLSLADATLSAKGTVRPQEGLAGVSLAVTVAVPDLAALSGVALRPLPSVRDLAVAAQVSMPEGGALAVNALHLTLPQADLAGDLSVTLAPRWGVHGSLSARTVDADALWQVLQAGPADAGPAASAPQAEPVAEASPVAEAAKAGVSAGGAWLDAADADLALSADALRLRGVTFQAVAAHAVLAAGRLMVDPLSATLPNGHVDARFNLAAPGGVPAISVGLAAQGLPLKPLMTLLGLPDDDSGAVELAADVAATGASGKALIGSLSGRVAVAATDGELDNRLLVSLGELLRTTRLPVELLTGAAAGRTRFRCVVVRSDLASGAGALGPLVLDTARLLVQGAGTINLGEATLELRLRPMLRTGGPGIVVPVRVTGSLSRPVVASDVGGIRLGSLLAGERGGDACGPAITAARGARPGGK